MKLDYSIGQVAPYINWIYFFHAWGTNGMTPQEKSKLQAEAEERLQRYADRYQTHGLFQLFEAYAEEDDIVVRGEEQEVGGERIPCLRQQQQGSEYLCLADFISPQVTLPASHQSSLTSKIGVFATTVDMGLETDFSADPYEKMMMQLLADRLAEATAEYMHQEVRKHYWGYAPDEQLTIQDLLNERWQGIRPAVGYPSLPDVSLNFVIDRLIGLGQIGIRLTEHGAMKPHASVSGLMIACPKAHYFSVGRIDEEQLVDYARRRGLPIELARRFLTSNLGE